MDWLKQLFDLFLHLDDTLGRVIAEYQGWTYVLLALVIFAETGLVFTPFLPGDSLHFTVGAFAGMEKLDIRVTFPLLLGAAILGNTSNYWIGKFLGPRILRSASSRFFNRRHLERTHAFYEKHGGMTIILAQFVPIVRTFAPFVAGIGAMTYRRFIAFNIVGALLWVSICMFAGYFFGSIPVVKNNFELVVLGIIAVSLLPAVIEFLRHRAARPRGEAA
ncbi:Inner membrane protein YghB [Phycisphaerae bacterium RAS1]|nr:Inner membrane protein YghB [Phycisphaerae bacterium RAS1]